MGGFFHVREYAKAQRRSYCPCWYNQHIGRQSGGEHARCAACNDADYDAGTYTLTWDDTDSNAAGCKLTKQVELTVNPTVEETVEEIEGTVEEAVEEVQ